MIENSEQTDNLISDISCENKDESSVNAVDENPCNCEHNNDFSEKNDVIVESEVVDEPVETTQEVNSCCDSKIDNFNEEKFKSIAKSIEDHFDKIAKNLFYSKEKDGNIALLTKELQNYREGFLKELFKPLAIDIIGLRENCKKSQRDFSFKSLSAKDGEKYLKYIVYDFEDMLLALNVEVDGDNVLYNGKSTKAMVENKQLNIPEILEVTEDDKPVFNDYSEEGIAQYLAECENYIDMLLKERKQRDLIVKSYVENSHLFEKGIVQVVLYPVINKIADVYTKLEEEVNKNINSITDENATSVYNCCIQNVIDDLYEILCMCGVNSIEFVSDTYDSKKQRILRLLPTENEEDDAKVANVFSDCYILDEKVIYPQKIEAYKFKK